MDWRLLIALVLSAGPAITGAAAQSNQSGQSGQAGGSGNAGAAATSDSQAAEVVTGPSGYVRVTEIGHPPLGMAGPIARSVARKNALARARESLLRTILALQTRDGRKVGDVLRQKPEHKPGLRSVLEHATVAGVELAGDAVEITLTVRMEGDSGLGRYLESIQSSPNRSP